MDDAEHGEVRTLKFKLEAVRMVKNGQSVAATPTRGPEQTQAASPE